MKNYKVIYIGLAEGYEIEKTNDETNVYDVFGSYIKAKADAMAKAKSDIRLVKTAYTTTKSIRKSDIK